MIADKMRTRLTALQPTALEIRDDSESHRGHAGFREGGESHFHIHIASPAFKGMSRLQRHRLVHATLGDIVPQIHALSLELSES